MSEEKELGLESLQKQYEELSLHDITLNNARNTAQMLGYSREDELLIVVVALAKEKKAIEKRFEEYAMKYGPIEVELTSSMRVSEGL